MNIKELEIIELRANKSYHDLVLKHRMEVDDAANEARRLAREAADLKYNSAIQKALNDLSDAKAAVLDAKTALALTGDGAPAPIGTVLYEWRRKKYSSYTYAKGTSLSGRVGVVTPVTKDFVHPANIGSYSQAKVGSFVLRLLKKDGTPGLQYIPLTSYILSDWLPEGISHPQAESKQ